MTSDDPPRLVELLNPPAGVVALAATHTESGRTWRHHEHLRLPSASLIKLPILACFWETVATGQLDPNERPTLSAEALRVEGTGVLKALAPGLQPTWSDLATLMITVSDNVATNLLIDRLGMEAIQACIDKAGLAETRIERRMMDRSAMSAGRGNWTSAADMKALLTAIAAGTCVSGEASGQMRRMLEMQQIQDGLPRRLGEGMRVANKTGNFADVIHDAGIVTSLGGTLVIAVLTQGVQPAWRAMDTIADIAAALVPACVERLDDQSPHPRLRAR
jgi:beta-lactamase class A